MTSLWNESLAPTPSDALIRECDVVVVGAGIAGLTTALLAARRGLSVCVLESRELGAGTTGHSSAKISLLHGTKYSRLLSRHPRYRVHNYVAGNRVGMDWLREFLVKHQFNTLNRTAATFATSREDFALAEQEYEAARSLALPVSWSDNPSLPFATQGAVTLDDQLLINPIDLLTALVRELRALGGRVVEHARVRSVNWIGRPKVTLANRDIVHSNYVVLATGMPILDRGLFFAKMTAKRSYVIALDAPGAEPMMAISAGDPTISVRDVHPADGPARVLVGGHGHVTGRTPHELDRLQSLREWSAMTFPHGQEVSAWSAQDHQAWDELPWAGPLPRGRGRIFLATGFDKWGFTNGVAAAHAIAGHLTGEAPPWARTWARRPASMRDALELGRINLEVGLELARGSKAEATEPTIDARCTHLGGPLRWSSE